MNEQERKKTEKKRNKLIDMSQRQYARLLKDLGFSDNEIIVETGYYIGNCENQ